MPEDRVVAQNPMAPLNEVVDAHREDQGRRSRRSRSIRRRRAAIAATIVSTQIDQRGNEGGESHVAPGTTQAGTGSRLTAYARGRSSPCPRWLVSSSSGTGRSPPSLHRAPTRELRDEGFVADLAGYRRGWGAAMDNRPGPPGLQVLHRRPTARVPQCAWPSRRGRVTAAGTGERTLPAGRRRAARRLDARERNYERLDVSDRVAAGGARVWVYAGRADSRDRLRAARRAGSAVVGGYLAAVEGAFAALGDDELALCAPVRWRPETCRCARSSATICRRRDLIGVVGQIGGRHLVRRHLEQVTERRGQGIGGRLAPEPRDRRPPRAGRRCGARARRAATRTIVEPLLRARGQHLAQDAPAVLIDDSHVPKPV